MRNRCLLAITLTLAALAVPRAGAQTIRGRLVDGSSNAPLVGALAELRDMQGKVIGQAFTSPTGAFVFVGETNQKYQLRVAAIGYARHLPIDVLLGAAPMTLPAIALSAVVITLPDLHAMGGKRACGKSELTPDTFGGLVESARTSLQMMDATLRSAQLGFEMQVVHRLAVKTSKDSMVSADTVAGVIHEWPVKSLSIDSLQLLGFQRPKTEAEGFGHHYYGPDMTVLMSDWFLETHCFTMDRDRSKGDTVVIKFDPMGHPKYVDVSGTLVLDRTSLTMRRLTYELRDLPDGVPDRSAGGEMRFAEKAPGLWVPIEWAIWAPMTRSERVISRPVFTSGTAGRAPGQRSSGMSPPPAMQSIPAPLVQVVGRDERRGKLTRIVPMGG